MRSYIIKALRVIGAVVLGIGMFLAIATPALATVDVPSLFSIDSVTVYESCLEPTDQLYLVKYTIDDPGYSCTPPVNPADPVTTNFLCRLMDGVTELRAVAPYAYYCNGYGEGIVSLYFSAADVATKGMGFPDTFTMKLEGNPVVSWTGGVPPVTSVATFDSWTTPMGGYLAGDVLYWADYLEIAWGVDLVETTAQGSKLTTAYGEEYFTNVIQNLATLCPSVFEGAVSPLQYHERVKTNLISNGTGALTLSSPVTLKGGTTPNIVDVAIAGTLTIQLPMGVTGTAATGTMTVNGSPVTLISGDNTITTAGPIGNIRITISETYADVLANQWAGTWLDFSPLAIRWDISEMWMKGLIWLLFTVGVAYLITRGANSYKPVLVVGCYMITFGAVFGFVPLLAGILVGVVGVILMVFFLFFHPSTS